VSSGRSGTVSQRQQRRESPGKRHEDFRTRRNGMRGRRESPNRFGPQCHEFGRQVSKCSNSSLPSICSVHKAHERQPERSSTMSVATALFHEGSHIVCCLSLWIAYRGHRSCVPMVFRGAMMSEGGIVSAEHNRPFIIGNCQSPMIIQISSEFGEQSQNVPDSICGRFCRVFLHFFRA
jgi:hypothetical protein